MYIEYVIYTSARSSIVGQSVATVTGTDEGTNSVSTHLSTVVSTL